MIAMKMSLGSALKGNHMGVLSIAMPMVLSNITVPLLGLVDAAVIGHLEHASYLGGVAVGGTMINLVLWLFGFLRMTTTGIAAQAYGAKDERKQVQILIQSVMLAMILSVILVSMSDPLSHVILAYSNASVAIKLYAEQYFLIRIISCPAALINLVFMGWLLGHHQAKKIMWLLILINSMNIVLDLVFVPGLKMGVKGAAIASVIADYAGSAVGLYFVFLTWRSNKLPNLRIKLVEMFDDLWRLLKFNMDIFIRSVFLQVVFSFMVFKGASLGDATAAANAILMNFLLFVSYVMDGFAYTMEALVGSAVGSKSKEKLFASLSIAAFWSLVVSLLCTFMFACFGENIIACMTSIAEVRMTAIDYLPWLVAFPLISMWSFLLDGVFVGATRGREMRNGMIIASAVYFLTYAMLHQCDNNALWGSMLMFMAVRWMILGCALKLQPIKIP